MENWTGAGHRAITLDDLELPVALDVLRAWGVKGDDAALARLIEPLNIGGFYHALSIAVLGSYLGNFAGGDPKMCIRDRWNPPHQRCAGDRNTQGNVCRDNGPIIANKGVRIDHR